MTFYQEIDWTAESGGLVAGIEPGSLAEELGLQAGDWLLAINEHRLQDVIDVQFFAAEETLELLVRREGELLLYEAEREYGQPLGLQFAHPTFDIDIRRCNNLCPFCFVLQMPARFRRTLYIKDDDYRYSFLFGHYVTLTNLSEHDWARIDTMHLSPLYVSVHVTDLELRRRFLRNPAAPDILEQLRWLAQRHIETHTQLVVVPGFNDGPWLEQSVRDLAELWPSVASVSVVPVGLTRHHKYGMRPHTSQEAAATLAQVEALQGEYQGRLGKRFLYATDEWYLVAGRTVPPAAAYEGLQLHENGLGMVRRFLDEWRAVQREIARWQGKEGRRAPRPAGEPVTLVTGTLFAGILRQAAAEMAQTTGLTLDVMPALNHRLGQTITVAGLLLAQDVLEQLQAHGHGPLVILPRVMFDHPQTISLDDRTPQQMGEALGCTIALADTMGDVWDVIRSQG